MSSKALGQLRRKLFLQSVGPATAKALSPYVLVLHLGNISKLATIDLKERDGLCGVIKSER